MNCQTGPYQPAIFTAADDDSVGDDVGDAWAGHGGVIQPGGYANPALEFDYGTFSLHDTRISYAQEAMQVTSGANADFSNLQIVNCETGIDDLWDEGANSQVTLTNCLIVSPDPDHAGNSAFAGGTPNTAFNLHKCTIDGFAELGGTGGDSSDPGSLYADQSAFSNIGGWGSGTLSGDWENGFWNTPSPFDPSGIVVYDSPYVQAGGGNYYLGDSYWTEEYAPTPPPVDYSNQAINQQTLGAQYSGEDDQAMGYCYPKLDCLFSGTQLNSGLVILPGTKVAWQGTGLSFSYSLNLVLDGTAANPCYFLPCNAVQEQGGSGTGITDASGSDGPNVIASFTRFWPVDNQAVLFDGSSLNVSAYNCEFWNGLLGGNVAGGFSLNMQNCLLENSLTYFLTVPTSGYCYLSMQNCTSRGGSLFIQRFQNPNPPYYNPHKLWTVEVHDSAFDNTGITVTDPYGGGTYPNISGNNNAYLSGANRIPNDMPDVTVASFNWENGLLGDSYLPNGSLLVDAGDATADQIYETIDAYMGVQVPLTHFTTQTSAAPDGGPADIGYHYFDDIIQNNMCPYSVNPPPSWHFCLAGLDGYEWDPDVYGLHLYYTILTPPTHGTLAPATDYGCRGEFIYTLSDHCYEGLDSFIYQISDGLVVSRPLVAVINVSDSITAPNQLLQTCINTPLPFSLDAQDGCYEQLSYPTIPQHTEHNGTLTGTPPNLTYTPPSPTYTGQDAFTYTVRNSCGNTATAKVTINVGVPNLCPISQKAMTGVGTQVDLTLTASDYVDQCRDNPLTFTITGGPEVIGSTVTPNSGTGSVVYTPKTDYEGVDTFTFTVSDGTWPAACQDATVTVFVVGGPILYTNCNPFGAGVGLNWNLDSAVLDMVQNKHLVIQDFKIYRATSPGAYDENNPLATVPASQTTYFDATAVLGNTYYYVIRFEYQGDPPKSPSYVSPYSDEVPAIAGNPNELVDPDATWDVTIWEKPTRNDPYPPLNPTHVGNRQSPFGYDADYATENPTQPPLVPVSATYPWQELDPNTGEYIYWSNHITLDLTGYTSQQLSQIVYSIAIDNSYDLYVNSQKIDHQDSGPAVWLPFQSLNMLNNLVAGPNNIDVVIWGDGADGSYFSMIVSGSDCGDFGP